MTFFPPSSSEFTMLSMCICNKVLGTWSLVDCNLEQKILYSFPFSTYLIYSFKICCVYVCICIYTIISILQQSGKMQREYIQRGLSSISQLARGMGCWKWLQNGLVKIPSFPCCPFGLFQFLLETELIFHKFVAFNFFFLKGHVHRTCSTGNFCCSNLRRYLNTCHRAAVAQIPLRR